LAYGTVNAFGVQRLWCKSKTKPKTKIHRKGRRGRKGKMQGKFEEGICTGKFFVSCKVFSPVFPFASVAPFAVDAFAFLIFKLKFRLFCLAVPYRRE